MSLLNNTKKNKKHTSSIKKSLKKDGAISKQGTHVFVSGRHQLFCPICKNNKFFTKQSMLRGVRWASFFDTEWLFDNAALIAVCEKCSHISWFKDSKRIKIENQKELNK